MVASSLITHSNIPCRAKDPETCKFHSAERRMNNAVENNDLDGYFRFRAQWEAAKVEDEVQEFLAAHPPVRDMERHNVEYDEALEIVKYHNDLDLEIDESTGAFGYDKYTFQDEVRLPNGNWQVIMRRQDGKLFGLEHEGLGYTQYGDEGDPFEYIKPQLIEVQAEDTVRIVTVYSPASQPTVEELES